jgi:hypothetical protein
MNTPKAASLEDRIADLEYSNRWLRAELKAVHEERAKLIEALRPFADAYRDGRDVALSDVPLRYFARAAELIPRREEKEE